ncbi:MAG: 23S rRNA (guanosine(2251)-2'-O)-methyltransferase RlmB [Candidatus Berkiellales bacterium]
MAQTKVIYGFHAVLAALAHHPEHVLNLFCEDKLDSSRQKDLIAKAKNVGVDVQPITGSKLDKMSGSTHHQGVAAQVRESEPFDSKSVVKWLKTTDKTPLLLILEGVQDPHNLGACLRSAEALGVDWVILPKVNTAPLNATVSKAACGADQTLPIVFVPNIVRFITDIQETGVWVVGTSSESNISLKQAALKRSLALVMGSEEKGLKRLTLEACDEIAKIPLLGMVESLNVSVATGISLYECQRQRNGVNQK